MIVLSTPFGDLCNRIFPYANVLAFAEERGAQVVNPGFAPWAHHFPHLADHAAVGEASAAGRAWRWLAGVSPRAVRLAHRIGLLDGLEVGPGDPLLLDGPDGRPVDDAAGRGRPFWLRGFYIVDSTSFTRRAERIRHLFRPRAEVLAEVDREAADARRDGAVVVGVHLRAGDYRDFNRGLYLYTPDELAPVCRAFAEALDDGPVTFVVCSNEPVDPAGFGDLEVRCRTRAPLVDLHLLARCDYLIGPPSTFSQWASFYGEVPRFVLNHKEERLHGLPPTPPEPERFRVHTTGFGRVGG